MTVAYEKNPETPVTSARVWLKIYTKNPYGIFFFGPFPSDEAARKLEYRYESLLQSEGKQVVASFRILPTGPDDILDSCVMSHTRWLQLLMEDYLHKKVIYTQGDLSTVIEYHPGLTHGGNVC